MKNILLKVSEEEHELLKQKAKEARQSLNKFMLSCAFDSMENNEFNSNDITVQKIQQFMVEKEQTKKLIYETLSELGFNKGQARDLNPD